jgi:hypothetical protein
VPRHAVVAGSPDLDTIRDRRSPVLHRFGDLRSSRWFIGRSIFSKTFTSTIQHSPGPLKVQFLLPHCFEIVVVRNVWNADDQNPHPTPGTVDDPTRDVDQRPLRNAVLHAVQDDNAAAVENVVQFGGSFVIMKFGTVNIDGVYPSGWV